MSGDFGAFGLTVTPSNVLGLRRVILVEAEELRAAVREFKGIYREGMPELGRDPVSPYAAKGFTECINTYLGQCNARIDDLYELGEHLAAAARNYGRTEDEISSSFEHGMRRDASPLVHPTPPPSGILGSHPDPMQPGGSSW